MPMRALFWSKVPDKTVDKTLWKDLSDKAVKLDQEELMSLFGTSALGVWAAFLSLVLGALFHMLAPIVSLAHRELCACGGSRCRCCCRCWRSGGSPQNHPAAQR